ncbi:adaptin ear-binding coat-associated protein 2-like [Amphiura filiformis]|uniref:adaptin ear-binding coat-associated protein 2-like n=1 Tax=Amphiura filiformis TaxID=82378 RepID=UPI003B225C53
MSADYESILCVKPEVHVYKIPPRSSNRGYRAADWKLDQPDWTGRLKVVAKGNECFVKLEDNKGELFAQAPVDSYPGIAVEAVIDSSRYFCIRIQNESGRHAFIGLGFTDRGDSFDFNVALQDHFKWVKQSKEIEEETKSGKVDTGPKLDLGFKEGQTITLNIGTKKSGSKPRGTAATGGVPGLLPPPPGNKIPTIPSPNQSHSAIPPQEQQINNQFGGFASSSAAAAPSQPQQTSNVDLFGGFSAPPPQQQASSQGQTADLLGGFGMPSSASQPAAQQQTGTDWGDFTSAQSGGNSGGNSWVQF